MVSSAGVKRGADHLPGSVTDSKKSKSNGSITAFFGAPKTTTALKATGDGAGSASDGPISNFNKDKWVSGLTAEQKELLKLEIDTLHESWLAHLKDELLTKEFLALKRFLKKEIDSGEKIFPPLEDVYSWYETASSLSEDSRCPASSPPPQFVSSTSLFTDRCALGLDIPLSTKSKP